MTARAVGSLNSEPPTSLGRKTIGLVGLGLVGQALAQRLQDHGWSCCGWDVSAQACERFAHQGHAVSASVAALVTEVDTVVLAVYDTAGVLAVVQQILDAPTRNTPLTLIDCSTGHPAQLTALHQRLQAHNIGLLEAPLSGSSAQIAAGHATLLLGGDPALIQAHDALLQTLSPKRHHLGAVGMGSAAKLASNLVLGLNRVALAEGLVLAQRLGLDAQAFIDLLLDSPARSEAVVSKGAQLVARDFTPRSRIRQHLKDLELMLEMAAQQGQGLPMTQAHRQLLLQAVAAGDGELDNAAVIRTIERDNAIPLSDSPTTTGD